MKIQTIFDKGTEEHAEDRTIVNLPFICVADGVSGLYVPSVGPKLFDEQTGGQMVCSVISEVISGAGQKESLVSLILEANEIVRIIQEKRGISLSRPDLLAGATFALAKIDEAQIEIIQAGDCFAVWERHDGKTGATRNQVYYHDNELFQRFAELMEKYGDRNRVWKELLPLIARLRIAHVNQQIVAGYGLLNGQPQLKMSWRKVVLPRNEVKLLLLSTDGLIWYPESGDEHALGQKTTRLFKEGGLDAILEETRNKEEEAKLKSHIDHAEATGVAVMFE